MDQAVHTDRPFFYGMQREDKKQPMTSLIQWAIKGYQARYGTEARPTYLVCHSEVAAELGYQFEGMQVMPRDYVNREVVYVGANPPS